MRRFRRRVLGATLLALALFAAACGDSGEDENGNGAGGDGEEKPSLTVGVSGAFAENQIVAEMYAQILEHHGYEVDRQTDIQSREISQPALVEGEIDVKPEYLASLLLFLNPEAEPSGDPAGNVELLNPLLEQDELELLEPSAANDTNALVITPVTANDFSQTGSPISTTSDLAPVAGDLTLGGPPECPQRPFCIPGFEEVYGIEFGDFRPLDVGGPLTVAALKGGKIDVALLFSTSSAIVANDWVVLEDDKNLQANESITPLIRSEVATDEVAQLLNSVSAELTTENITELNGRVELDQEDPADVAADFLEQSGLLD